MTREEIENALLTTGAVHAEGAERIELTDGVARRLAALVFDRLRSTELGNLRENQDFFQALELTYQEHEDDPNLEAEADTSVIEPEAPPEERTWRLKRIETKGFGGLNAASSDVFVFDVAGRNVCIEGQNGSGKSSLANAILFAMTGKIHRDQHGLWDNPTRLEPVFSDLGLPLGDWAPIATYPEQWGSDRPIIDVSVTLTFGNDTDGEEIQAGHPQKPPLFW
ncbi:MAG: AAA family ATPase [Thalassobaculaceae bacterium]